MKDRRIAILTALALVDGTGAVVARRHRIVGEPLGVGTVLDVRRPAVLVFWGTGLSAPLASFVAAAMLLRRSPTALRVLGALFAAGAMAEPVFWGRRPCPRYARALLVLHVALGLALAGGAPEREASPVG